MSDHSVNLGPNDSPISGPAGLLELVIANIRQPAAVAPGDGVVVYSFTPDLTPAEAATFGDCIGSARTSDLAITFAEFRAIKSQLAEIRTFRTRTLAQWNGLTTAQREADEISYLNDLTDVLRALLRQ